MEKVRFEHRFKGSEKVSPCRRATTAKALVGSMSVTFPHPLACWRKSTKQGRQAIRPDGAFRLRTQLLLRDGWEPLGVFE